MSSHVEERRGRSSALSRGRRAAPPGRARTSSGAPSAMTRPWWSTVIRWAMENTTSMSCSVKSSVSPRSRAIRSMSRMVSRVSLRRHARRSARRGAGSRGSQRQRDAQLELLLVAVGEEAADLAGAVEQADRGRAAPPSRRDRGARPGVNRFQPAPAMGEEGGLHVLVDGELAGRCWCAGRSGPCRAGRGRAGAMPVTSRPLRSTRAGVGLEVAGDQVEERRLARAVGADDGADRAPVRPSTLTPPTARKPSKLLRTSRTSSTRGPPRQPAHERACAAPASPPGKHEQQHDQDDAEHERPVLGVGRRSAG